MQLERFTVKAQEALQSAQATAQQYSHQEIDGEHLMLALIDQPEGLIQPLLQKLGIPISGVRSDVERELARRAKVQGSTDTFLGNTLKRALDAAQAEAGKLKDDYTSTEHLLLALLTNGGSSLKKIFQAHSLKYDAVLKALAELRGNQRVTDQNPEDKFQALEKYGRDLTALARSGKIDPVIGRDGEIRCIGATTLDEYRKHIEKDPALERRFQPVYVEEPSVEATIAILRGLKERYEVHHGVRIQDAALVAAATLSHRYITDRFLPDKAIDLVDEASAVIRTEIDSMPQELDAITRRVMQLEIEEAALQKETDEASRQRLEALRRELADLRAQADAMTAQWEAERQAIRRLQALREELEHVRREIEEAERRYDLNRAAELRHGQMPELERQLH